MRAQLDARARGPPQSEARTQSSQLTRWRGWIGRRDPPADDSFSPRVFASKSSRRVPVFHEDHSPKFLRRVATATHPSSWAATRFRDEVTSDPAALAALETRARARGGARFKAKKTGKNPFGCVATLGRQGTGSGVKVSVRRRGQGPGSRVGGWGQDFEQESGSRIGGSGWRLR